MGALAAKYLFLVGLYAFVVWVVREVVVGLREAAGAPRRERKPGARARGARLVVGNREVALPGRGELVIGRGPESDLRVADAFASSRHCVVAGDGRRWWVRDLGSRNGTKVNGEAVVERELRDGDRLEVGGTTIVFRAGA